MESEEKEGMLEFEATPNVVESALSAGLKIAEFKTIPREEGKERSVVLVPKGFNAQSFDNERERPLRKTGSKQFLSTGSFCSYVNKHKVKDETIIMAYEDKGEILAVLNDNGNEPDWGDFTAILDIGFSKQWNVWFGNSYPNRGNYFEQEEFANFIEDNRSDLMVGTFKGTDDKDVENISALELSAIITNLQMTSQEKFTSKVDPVSGRLTLNYENEEHGKGNVEIPKQIILAIPIYRGGDIFEVVLRLRHRIRGGNASFYFIIDQLELLKERAFDMICRRIEKGNKGSEEDPEKQFDGTGIEVYRAK